MFKFCSAPWKQVQIHQDGTVQPCLCGGWHTAGTAGNMLTQSMAEIMQDESVKRLKQGVLDQSFSVCHDRCPYKWKPEMVEQLPDFVNDLTPLPAEILLAIDMNCNLKCSMCRPGSVFAKKIDPTAQAILDKLVSSYRHTKTPTVLQMDGAGDVFASEAWKQFLWRDDMPECFRFHIITNGNLDATQEETYSQVRGGKLGLVLEGLEWMRDNDIRTTISFVVQRRNYREMMDCWRLAHRLGCHSINFQGVERFEHMSDEYWQYTRLEDNPDVDVVHLRESLARLDAAPTVVDFTGKSPPPVYMDGTLRKFIDQR